MDEWKYLGVTITVDPGLSPDGIVYLVGRDFVEAYMKLTDHKVKFDPSDRLKDGKYMTLVLSPKDWFTVERELGRRISSLEIHDLIMGVFAGAYKIVKR